MKANGPFFRREWEAIMLPILITGVLGLCGAIKLGCTGYLTDVTFMLYFGLVFWLGSRFDAAPELTAAIQHQRRKPFRATMSIQFLRAFRWFCTEETRDTIQLVIADLKRDLNEMRKEGRSNAFISAALMWQTQRSVLGILLNALLEFVRQLLPIGKLVQSVKKFW